MSGYLNSVLKRTLCLFLLSFASSSLGQESEPMGVVMALNGKACLQELKHCRELKTGDEIPHGTEIWLESGTLRLFDLSRRAVVDLSPGKHKMISNHLWEQSASSQAAQFKKHLKSVVPEKSRLPVVRSALHPACSVNRIFRKEPDWLRACLRKSVSALKGSHGAGSLGEPVLPQFSFYRRFPEVNLEGLILASENFCGKAAEYKQSLDEGPVYLIVTDAQYRVYGFASTPAECVAELELALESLSEAQDLMSAEEQAIAKAEVLKGYGLFYEAIQVLETLP